MVGDFRGRNFGMRLCLHVDELGTDLCMLAIRRLVLFAISVIENRGIFMRAATVSTAVMSDLIILYSIFSVWGDTIVERKCVKQSSDGRFWIHTDKS
jgi:hypothetical protein